MGLDSGSLTGLETSLLKGTHTISQGQSRSLIEAWARPTLLVLETPWSGGEAVAHSGDTDTGGGLTGEHSAL